MNDGRLSAVVWAVAAILGAAGCGREPPTGVVVGPPAALVVVSGNQQHAVAGQPLPLPLVVRVVDASGAGVHEMTVQWNIACGHGTLSPSSTVTDFSGYTSATWVLGPSAEEPNCASAEVSGLPNVIFLADAVVGPAVKLVFRAQPRRLWAGLVMSAVAVDIADALGNRVYNVTGGTISVTLGANPGNASLGGTTTMNVVQGEASFSDLSIDQPGTRYALEATTGTLSGASAPIDVTAYPVFVDVSTGTDHSCGLTADGVAYCWGGNGYGQLGDSSNIARVWPLEVAGGLSFARISAGNYFTCALTTSGAAFCWGRNMYGELGHGDTIPGRVPIPVAGGIIFTAISTSSEHTCGLTTDGRAFCWGVNRFGQLGVDSAATMQACNAGTDLHPDVFQCSYTPVPVAGGLRFTTLSAGRTHTCGMTADGAAYCWGLNGQGQFGSGTVTPYTSNTPMAAAGSLALGSITAGGMSTCGVTTSGAAYCWGAYAGGALVGDTTDQCMLPYYPSPLPISPGYVPCSSTPVPISGGLVWASLSTGGYYSCGVAITAAGYCWGANSHGWLGNGSTAESLVPLPVSGGLTFTRIHSGTGHTCAITTDGALYCWGYNSTGQLGNGSTIDSPIPVRAGSRPMTLGAPNRSASNGQVRPSGATL